MSRDLSLLNPKLRVQALELQKRALSDLGLKIIFTQTLRSEEEQQALYAQGRSPISVINILRAKAGLDQIDAKRGSMIVTKAKSAKDSMHSYGLAFDIAITNSTGKTIDWNHSDWNDNNISDWDEVGKLGETLGLEWGGNWSSLRDPPHFQNRFGLTMTEIKSGKLPQ